MGCQSESTRQLLWTPVVTRFVQLQKSKTESSQTIPSVNPPLLCPSSHSLCSKHSYLPRVHCFSFNSYPITPQAHLRIIYKFSHSNVDFRKSNYLLPPNLQNTFELISKITHVGWIVSISILLLYLLRNLFSTYFLIHTSRPLRLVITRPFFVK